MKIKNVVVIGSGTMGSGIAAHLCNASVPVTLLDLKTEISEKARDRIYKSKPPLLIDKSKINNIKVGNINDDFNVVEGADWVVEAVVERIDIKHQIYEKIFKSRKDGAIVSSNTSSIPIKVLSENLTDKQKKDFCITHFFNPVNTFMKITLPLILPGVISGGLFAFVTSFDEVVVVLFLAGLENTTIPIQMWTGLREQLSPTILAVATCLIILSTLILVTAELLRRRSERLRGINQ